VARFEDDGSGMSEEVREHLFDPFFTTKPVGEGTGLGLAISYEIVNAHGGEMRVQSTPGRGACIEVFLPLADEIYACSDS
jgi:signal transduction histidine kinase